MRFIDNVALSFKDSTCGIGSTSEFQMHWIQPCIMIPITAPVNAKYISDTRCQITALDYDKNVFAISRNLFAGFGPTTVYRSTQMLDLSMSSNIIKLITRHQIVICEKIIHFTTSEMKKAMHREIQFTFDP